MSTSSEIVDSLPPLPNSNFTHTFNLFTQYLKMKKQENADLPLPLPLGMTSSAMNLFPEEAAAGFPQKQKKQESGKMTIFYAGQVMVVDDYKAIEILMMLGGKEKASDWISKTEPLDLTTHTIKMENQSVRLPGLPIARKASLARFLEKRKERITARAPYQVEKAAWLGSP